MRKKHRKFRKPPRDQTDLLSVSVNNNENSYSSIVRDKRQMHNFSVKTSESVNRSYQISNSEKYSKNHKKNKRKKKSLQNSTFLSKSLNVDCVESEPILLFPLFKKSSVSFFIPLDHFYDVNKNYSFNHTIELRSNIWLYENTSFSMISQYKFEHSKESDKIVTPATRKYRTSSESSVTSEDSLISFLDNVDDDIVTFSATIIHRNIDNSTQFVQNEASGRVKFCKSNSQRYKTRQSSKGNKKVHFKNSSELVTVHNIIAWDFAYRAARISPWETVARDAKRFKQKILSLESVLSPILDVNHRKIIWNARFNLKE